MQQLSLLNRVIVNNLGTELHYVDGGLQYLKYLNGIQTWWLHGQRHRTDGPAYIAPSGLKEYWLHGKQVSEEEFNKRRNK